MDSRLVLAFSLIGQASCAKCTMEKKQGIREITFVPQLKNRVVCGLFSSVGRSEGSLFAQPEATFVKEV